MVFLKMADVSSRVPELIITELCKTCLSKVIEYPRSKLVSPNDLNKQDPKG